MRECLKHTIECNCILPQFLNHNPIVFHRFVVFSVIEEDGSLRPSVVECNNCGAVHRVKEVGQSAQLSRESSSAIPKIEELKTGIPDPVVRLLESYKVDLPTWQEVRFIYDEQKWGRQVVLTREEDDGMVVGKYLLVLGQALHKIDSFMVGGDDE